MEKQVVLTRPEVVDRLGQEGYALTERTIRYWEAIGLLPRPAKVGRRVVYTQDQYERARFLAATRPRQMAKVRKPGREVYYEIVGEVLILHVRPKRRG